MSEQRDRAEEERMKELTKKLNKEKEEALAAQWEECQRLQGEAVEAACSALRKQLRDEFAVEREQAIAEALKTARVSSLHKSLVIKIQSSGLLFSLLFFRNMFQAYLMGISRRLLPPKKQESAKVLKTLFSFPAGNCSSAG